MLNCECTGKATVGNGTIYFVRDGMYITEYTKTDLLNRLLRGNTVGNLELSSKETFRVKKGMREIPDWTAICKQNKKRKLAALSVRRDTLNRLGFTKTKGEITRGIAKEVIKNKYSRCKVVELAMGGLKTCYLALNALGENRHLLVIPSDVESLDSYDSHYVSGLNLLSSALRKLQGSLMVVGGSGLKNVSSMFSGCWNLSEIDFRGFDTTNVNVMTGFLQSCPNLILVDVSGLDTSSMYDMSCMFCQCPNLKEIRGLNNFSTTFATSIGAMFCECKSLSNVDLSSFHTANTVNMRNMFKGCSSLTSINFGKTFTMERVVDATCMFAYCSSLIDVDLSMCQFADEIKVLYMFTDCKNLRHVNITRFNPIIPSDEDIRMGRVEYNAVYPMDIYSMFEGCCAGINLEASQTVHNVLNRFKEN